MGDRLAHWDVQAKAVIRGKARAFGAARLELRGIVALRPWCAFTGEQQVEHILEAFGDVIQTAFIGEIRKVSHDREKPIQFSLGWVLDGANRLIGHIIKLYGDFQRCPHVRIVTSIQY